MAQKLYEHIRCALGMSPSKPFKVQDINGKKRVGLVASGMKDLRKKGTLKLGIKDISSIVLEEDGSEVESDGYLKSLPAHTVLIFLRPGEVWEGYITYLKMASNKIIDNFSIRKQTVDQIQELLCDPESPELLLMMDFVNAVHANLNAETRSDDPEWFDGVSEKYKTKVQTMRNSAKGRIRNYMQATKEFSEKTTLNKFARSKLTEILDKFTSQLKAEEYFGEYFDRSVIHKEDRNNLCTEKGWFHCQGPFDGCGCKQLHTINPYGTKEARVLFSTWNLDHQIEKSRTVLPNLMDAVKRCPVDKEVNWKYFFGLLFTMENLKLVDIRCHKKCIHSNRVDTNRIFVSAEIQ